MSERPDFPSRHGTDCPECGARVPNDAPVVHTRNEAPRVACPACDAWFVVRLVNRQVDTKTTKNEGAVIVARDALIEGRSDVLAKLGEEARAHLWACMQDLCERLTSAQRAAWPECPDVYIIHETGREKRFIRIVHVTKNVDGTENQRGCWAHVELSNGLVWDGGWKKPYDNYPRGCVLDEESREDLGARWAGLGGTKPYHEDLR